MMSSTWRIESSKWIETAEKFMFVEDFGKISDKVLLELDLGLLTSKK